MLYTYFVEDPGQSGWSTKRDTNYNALMCSPLLFYSNRARPFYQYKVHFYSNTAGWKQNITNVIHRGMKDGYNCNQILAMIQTRSEYSSTSDEASGNGLDFNAIYYRIIPLTNQSLTESGVSDYLRANYKVTNSDQLLSVFTYKGRGKRDFVESTNRILGHAVYRFYRAVSPVVNNGIHKYPTTTSGIALLQDTASDYVHVWTNNEGVLNDGRAGYEAYVLNSWNSKIAKNLSDIAKISADAKYPDGVYAFWAQTKNVYQPCEDWFSNPDHATNMTLNTAAASNFINDGIDPAGRRMIVIDNFMPYVQSVRIVPDPGANAVYHASWASPVSEYKKSEIINLIRSDEVQIIDVTKNYKYYIQFSEQM